jgi:hypothetical protein
MMPYRPTFLKPAAVALAVAGAGVVGVSTAQAAFVIEPNGKASTNFSAENATGNSTAAGSGSLAAPGLTDGAASVFGGEPYTYTYTPASDGDNTNFNSGGTLNSFAGLEASGLEAGGAGLYNVYRTYPQSGNNTDQPTTYDVDVLDDGTIEATDSYDQNTASLNTGLGIGLWELIGTVEITDPSSPVTVNISTDVAFGGSPGFVGARTAGVMFEPVPEPTSAMLLAAGSGLMLVSRRRRA